MIPGIIVSHGKLAEELKVAVELIVGPSRKLHAISNEGFEPDSLAESIRKHFPENQPVFIFTDLRGGSQGWGRGFESRFSLKDHFKI